MGPSGEFTFRSSWRSNHWVIGTSKHGQSPINPVKVTSRVISPIWWRPCLMAPRTRAAQAVVKAGAYATGPCGFVSDDDIGLIWRPDQTMDLHVTDYLNTNAVPLLEDEVLGRAELKLRFHDALKDSRTPDVIIQPPYGTIYTTSSKQNAEHGVSFGDTNVGLIVSNPSVQSRVLKMPVATSQVAPTILQRLGIDASGLNSVRVEKTVVLPFTDGDSK